MRSLLLLVAFTGLFGSYAFSQRACGTQEYYEYQKANDPSFELRQQEIEQFTNEFITHSGAADRALVTIPVVVHVVWNTTTENITDAQVLSQITVLNQDFRKLNSDWTNTPSVFQPSVADVNIEFCLATVDPNGNPTNGITRTQTSVTAFGTNDQMKFSSQGGRDAWPASKYLNIWVCDISGGILGYAQFPGGSATTDGVVVDYQYYGTVGTATAPFNKGRTGTHEVGHWLNLRHIWGDANCGNDLVTDTPTQQGPNSSCPAFPRVTCSNGPNGDMFMNYMDYTDDACMFMFSNGQASRMQALFAAGGARSALLTSNGCTPANTTCGIPTGLSTTSITASGANLSWAAVTGATSYNLRYKLTSSSTWISVNGLTGTTYALSGLAACSAYEWQAQAICQTGAGSFSGSATFTTTGCVATYCASSGGTVDEWINRVVLNTINNTSGNNGGYGNYTTISTTLNAGSAYSFSGTPGHAGTAYAEFWRVWIDYNGDLDFDDAGELVYAPASASSTVVTGNFTVPSSITPKTTRMRVSMRYGSAPVTCGTFQYGEVEDYTVVIAAPVSGGTCNTNYEANNTSATATAINLSTIYNSFICPTGDQDWFRFSNTSSQRHIQVTLQSLPADYDINLYNPSGVLVASSANGGTANETISFNNGPIGTYRVQVIGYNGATNGSDSYELRATRRSTVYRLGDSEELDEPTTGLIAAYPNPTRDLIDVKFIMGNDAQAEFRLVDMIGREVFFNRFLAGEGENIYTIDMSSLAAGTYVLVMNDGETIQTTYVVKE